VTALEPVGPEAEVAQSLAWEGGAAKRFAALASARVAAQGLGLVWFVVAARALDDSEFGELATGLVFVAVFAGIGDLGTTRSIVRHVAADRTTLWGAYWRGLVLRVVGGLGTSLPVVAVLVLIDTPVSPVVVLLAGLVATAGGATELAYAGLRSVSRVRMEVTVLIGERIAFLVLGVSVLIAGWGAVAVLVVYLVTNLGSAGVSGVVVNRARSAVSTDPGWSFDREARFTAVSFALVTVGPRVAPLLVALLAASAEVALFSVAQRPVEAITLFALSTAAPVLPMVRERISRGRRLDAEMAVASAAGAIGVAVAPLLAWFLVSPTMVLELLFGGARYDGAEPVLRLLSLTSLTWTLRGTGEFFLLAEERASRLVAIAVCGIGLTVACGVPLIVVHGATGAAIAVVVAEIVMTALLLRWVPALAVRAASRAHLPVLVGGGLSVLVLVLTRSSTAASVAAVGVITAGSVVWALRLLRGLEGRA
jgi:O-antigen/teichoic acid export membrane protein